MRHRNIAFVVTDSNKARIVMWDPGANGYRAMHAVHDGPGSVAEGAPRHTGGRQDREVIRNRVRVEFVRVLTEHVRWFAAQYGVEGVVLAAPARVLSPLKVALKVGPPILGLVAKDLTRYNEHELRTWLIAAEQNVAL